MYTSDRKGNKDLWEKRTNGGYAQPLTKHSADDYWPVLSPKGKKIAFVSRRGDAAGDIHILGLGPSLSKLYGYREGSVSQIKNPWTEDGNPSWFPNGERVVFVARKPGETEGEIMTSELADLKPVPLSPDTKGNQPSVAPNGKDVVYVNKGGIKVYDEEAKRITRLTTGGLLQDGQPRFSTDGKSLFFIRYADDTNRDGLLNGDDRPTIWRLDVEKQAAAKGSENYRLYPLTSASFAGYSPQMRGKYLYFTLQDGAALDVFRLPAFGQRRPPESMDELRELIDKRSDYYDKIYLSRLAQAHFASQDKMTDCAEAALLEIDTYVQNGRDIESKWAYRKLKSNFPKQQALVALADLAIIQLQHEPYSYPKNLEDPDRDTLTLLKKLEARIDKVVEKFADAKSEMGARVLGRAQLVRAKLLAAKRDFFKANEIASAIPLQYSDDRRLAAEGAFFSALIAPAISNRSTAVAALRQVVKTYPDQRQIVRLASREAVRLVTEKDNYIEDLVALRSASSGLPVLPALAHMRIADDYLADEKQAVSANELRQIVELYPESPEVLLTAAKRLSRMDEEAGRYSAAEKMLQTLNERLKGASTEQQKEGRRLLIRFWLRRGETMLGEGKRDDAVHQFHKVTAIEPLNVSAHRGIIDATFKTPQFEALVDKYDDDASADSESAEKIYFKGYAETYDIDFEN